MSDATVSFDLHTKSGLHIRHISCEAGSRETFSTQDISPAIGYNFCLEGDIECCVPEAGFTNRVLGGQAGMWRQADAPMRVTLEKGRHTWLEIGITREMLEPILEENELRVDHALRQAVLEGDAPFALARKPGDKACHLVARMLANPFTGGLASCYLESKALELMVEEIEHVFMKRPAIATGRGYARQVKAAAGFMAASLESPPTIAETARHVHLSETTLKRAFRNVYGTSIFSWFQSYRMETARDLLTRGGCNVAEAAFTVGYANPGHFSRAFARHFGFSPKKTR